MVKSPSCKPHMVTDMDTHQPRFLENCQAEYVNAARIYYARKDYAMMGSDGASHILAGTSGMDGIQRATGDHAEPVTVAIPLDRDAERRRAVLRILRQGERLELLRLSRAAAQGVRQDPALSGQRVMSQVKSGWRMPKEYGRRHPDTVLSAVYARAEPCRGTVENS